MEELSYEEAIRRIESGVNPLDVLEKTCDEDKDAVREYLNAFGD